MFKIVGWFSDVDECKLNPCGANAICTDTIGSFVCSCKEDFTGDPFKGCVDINECVALDKPCGSNAICENSSPGYNCVCPQGYVARPDAQIACEQVRISIFSYRLQNAIHDINSKKIYQLFNKSKIVVYVLRS